MQRCLQPFHLNTIKKQCKQQSVAHWQESGCYSEPLPNLILLFSWFSLFSTWTHFFSFPPWRHIFLHCASLWSNGSSVGKHRLANSPPHWYIQYDPAALTLCLSQPVGQCCGIDHRSHAGNMLTATTLLHSVQPVNILPWQNFRNLQIISQSSM